MTAEEQLTALLMAGAGDCLGKGGALNCTKLADYLLEHGVIVTPVKVGDVVYIIENPYTFLPLKKPLGGEVVSIHLHEHGLFLRVLFDTRQIDGYHDYNLDWELSKTVFLTREEAEQALKEREDNG